MVQLRRNRPAAEQGGFTLVELMVALTASLIVTFALGQLVMTNQRAWRDGTDRAVLQQNLSQVLDWIGSDVRGAARVDLQGGSSFRLLDRNGQALHTYTLQTSGGDTLLQRDGRTLVPRTCPVFSVAANADTTILTITVDLRGQYGKRVSATTAVAIRGRDLENAS